MGNRQNCAKFQKNLFRSNEIISIFCPPLFRKQPIPYFFAYKAVFFSFQNNPKNLDPSYKMDLDLWDCLGRVKLVL